MANYTSQPLEVAPVTSSFNFDLIDKVQAVQQQKYDTAKSNINSAIAQLGAMQLARPQDREYLEQRKQMMINSINEMPHKNLANSNVADSYYSVIKDVARDPYVLSAIENTAKIQNFEAQMSQLKEKTPEKYAERNYADALDNAGFSQYMNGEIDKLGEFNYTPFEDVASNVRKRAKELKALKGDMEVEVPLGNGQVVVKKLSGLTAEEIIQAMPTLLTSQDEAQLAVDGRHLAKNNPSQVEREFETYRQATISDYNTRISEKQTNSYTKKADKDRREQELRTLEQERDAFIERTSNTTVGQKGYVLNRAGFINILANSIQGRVSETYKKDDYFFAKENLRIDKAKLKLQEDKFEWEKQQAQPEDIYSGIVSNPVVGKQEDFNPTASLMAAYDTQENEIISVINTTKSSVDDVDVLRDFDNILKEHGYNTNGTALVGGSPQISYREALERAFYESGMSKTEQGVRVSTTIAASSEIANTTALTYNNTVGEGYKEAYDTRAEDIQNTFVTEATTLIGKGEQEIREPIINGISDLYEQVTGKEATDFKEKMNGFRTPRGTSPDKTTFETVMQGFSEIHEAIKGDPVALRKYGELLDNIIDTNSNFDRFDNFTIFRRRTRLADVASEISNSKISEIGAGQRPVWTDEHVVSNAQLNGQIINSISTTQLMGSGSEVFDPKESITLRYEMKGNVPIIVAEQPPRAAKNAGHRRVEFNTEDAGYRTVMAVFNQTDFKGVLDARQAPSNTNITPKTTVSFYDPDENLITGEVAQTHLVETIPQNYYRGANRIFLANPAEYIFPDKSFDFRVENTLNNSPENYTSEEVAQIKDYLKSNIGEYNLRVFPKQGMWVMEVTKGQEVVTQGYLSKTQSVLDPVVLDMVTNYPHTIIVDRLLSRMYESRSIINKL